jgi:hypothetical protein
MNTQSTIEPTLELPASLKDFLEVWSPYQSDAILREINADDPIWDWVPLIKERSEHVWTTTFVGFWRPDGQYAFPAVTTRNVSFRSGGRVIRQGQSIRDAYLKKGAKWITILMLSGRFENIELLNLTHSIPKSIKESDAKLSQAMFAEKKKKYRSFSREQRVNHLGGQDNHPALAWLDSYVVAESPPPVTITQRIWSAWRRRRGDN